MTASFTTTRLVNERAVVRGTDKFGAVGETVVSTSQWDEISAMSETDKARESFDQAVKEFFAPLERAAEKAHRDLKAHKPKDQSSYVVIDEGSEGEPARAPHLIQLNRDSVVLRLIEEGAFDRLIWVDGQVEVLESEHSGPAQQAADQANLGDGGGVTPVEGTEG